LSKVVYREKTHLVVQ